MNRFPWTRAVIVIGTMLCILWPDTDGQQFSGMEFRFIGPGQAGGRISDIQVHPQNPAIIYVAAATGGIFKTEDACLSWTPIFDQAGSSLSIGDMAIDQNNPDVLWAGTGEAGGEQSSASIGNGVYRSLNGGETWTHMGLTKTQHISRVVIDQGNSDKVFVAANGTRWGANPERGLYRTQNGGQTWEQILFIDENTGVSDVVIHPEGQILLASTYMQRRNAWGHVRSGPTSGLYRSSDGGTNWKKIESFPNEPIGRIALWMAPSNPAVVYACLESASGGLYRSNDAGVTWKLVNERQSTSYWYGRLYGNPNDENHVFVMGVNIAESKNGGKKFDRIRLPGVHVDHHIYWINPKDENHRLIGNDGGLYLTINGGTSWDFVSNLPIQQYYAISIDQRDPYFVYGGLQDNGVWGGPSQSYSGTLVNNDDIIRICGGDGFYSDSDPTNPMIVYGASQYGFLTEVDLRTQSRRMIKPQAPEGKSYRFNWNTPYFISVHPPHAMYLGSNYALKTMDRGQSWEAISEDLSRNQNLDDKVILGQKPVLKPYASITALAESPLKPGLLLAGTDDGRLHMTLNDGLDWTDQSHLLPMPEDRFFTRVLWSTRDLGTAYAACARYYEASDFSPYLFKTTDFGNSWELITNGLPENAIIKGLAEHPDKPELLFSGSHNALFFSLDGGELWRPFQLNLPPVAIDDIKLAFPANDLVLGSYGRGIIILDHIDFLSNLNQDILNAECHLFSPVFRNNRTIKEDTEAPKYDFHAPNPSAGLTIDYFIEESADGPVEFTLVDQKGTLILNQAVPALAGINRKTFDVQIRPGKYALYMKYKASIKEARFVIH